jgi:hypothetical protein
MYDSGQWSDFFVTVGGGAAALTGLVFVAMSMHLSEIVANPIQPTVTGPAPS